MKSLFVFYIKGNIPFSKHLCHTMYFILAILKCYVLCAELYFPLLLLIVNMIPAM